MTERRVNLMSLVTGLLSLGVAGLYFLYRTNTIFVDEHIVFAGTIVALGVGGVATSAYGLLIRRRPRRHDDDAD